MNVLNTPDLLKAINTGKLPADQVDEARKHLDEEIFQCDEVIQDPETEFHVRDEYRGYRSQYTNALTKLKLI